MNKVSQRLRYGSVVKNPPANAGEQVRSLGFEDPLEEKVATHSRILAWEIPWIESAGIQPMGSQRVRHDLATKPHNHLSLSCRLFWRAKCNVDGECVPGRRYLYERQS